MIPVTTGTGNARPVESFTRPRTLAEMGALIRRYRRRKGYTLNDLTRVSGVSKAYLSLIERAQIPNPPSDGKLVAIERAIELPASTLTDAADLMRTPPSVRALLDRLMNERGEVSHAKV